ncbi:uncharacterized protein LOC144909978 [Branchiostoma floridae x Branchiostoma belcheri]
MRTTILAAFFYLIGFSCASMLAFILYLTRYGKDMEVARSDLDYSIKLLRRGAIVQNTLGFSDRKQIDIADKVADLKKTRPDVVSTVATTCKRPSVRPGIAGRGNSHSSRPPEAIKETNNSAQQTQDRHKQFVRSGSREQKKNETLAEQKLNQGNHQSLPVVEKDLHSRPTNIRKEFAPVAQGQSRHSVLQKSPDGKKEPDTSKVEPRKESAIVDDRTKQTGLLTSVQNETLSSKHIYFSQQHHSGLNSTSKYRHDEKKSLVLKVETDKKFDDHGKISKQFPALNATSYTRDNESVSSLVSVKSHKTKRSRLPVVEDGLDRVDTDGHRQATGDQCAPKKHFVWIKVHKAGSQTTNPIFERFAYKHQLKLLFGISNGPTVSWPRPPRWAEYVHPPTGGPFDALYVHSRYNKTWMQAHFPNDTVYLSIVKDPFSHFKSSFHYYGLPQHLNLQDWNPVKTFLKNPWKYKTEALYQGIRFDKTRNAQLFDLGFPIEKSHDRIWAEEYIKQLDRDFLLVIILEHYAESLVLLKRLMCWELSDILLVEERINSRNYRYKHYSPTREELKRYKMYAEAEYVMYQRFNQSLWTKIGQQSQDFFQEVENYKRVTRRVRTFCKHNSTQELLISASPWNPQYKMRQSICTYLKIHDIEWRTHSWAQLRYPPRIKRLLRQEYFNNISKYHDKLLAAARQDSAENQRS